MAYTTISAGLSGNTVWTAGTYYLTANVTMGSYNLTLDCSGGSIYIKTSGAVGIQQNGAGVLTTDNTSVTNKVVFTSKNDNAHGDAITGSSGSPAYTDQTVGYVDSMDSGSLTMIYWECWYFNTGTTGRGCISYSNTSYQSGKSFYVQYGIIKYGRNTSNPNYSGLIGYANAAVRTKLIDTFFADNIVIDNTNLASTYNIINCSGVFITVTITNSAIIMSNSTYQAVTLYSSGANITIQNNIFIIPGTNANLTVVSSTASNIKINNNIISTLSTASSTGMASTVSIPNSFVMYNNIFYGCNGANSYAVYGTGTHPTEDYNCFYNNNINSNAALGAHSITVNPSLTNIATGAINPSFAIPDGYAIVKGGSLDKAGSDTFANLGWDVTRYSPTGYKYASTDKINIGILYNIPQVPSAGGGSLHTGCLSVLGAIGLAYGIRKYRKTR